MKKIKFTLIIMLAVASVSLAQKLNSKSKFSSNKSFKKVIAKSILSKSNPKFRKSASNYTWVNFGDALSNSALYNGITDPSSSSFNTSTFPIWPDSLALISGSFGSFRWWNHAYAEIFSPASNFIADYAASSASQGLNIPNAQKFFNRNCSYRIDSIRVYFTYTKNHPANDTLNIYYAVNNNVTENSLAFFMPGVITSDTVFIYNLGYDFMGNKPSGISFAKISLPLTYADTGFVIKSIPVNANINESSPSNLGRFGNALITAFQYVPHPGCNLNDTLLDVSGNNVTHKLNDLEILTYQENAGSLPTSFSNEHSLNIGNLVSSDVRYNLNPNWNGSYVPSMAFSANGGYSADHAYIDYHLNYQGAAFSYTNTVSTANFTDLSNFSPITWVWDFGDGGSDFTQNPTHTYNSGGNYTVCLTASDGITTLTTCQNVHIVGCTTGITAVGSTTFCPGNSINLMANGAVNCDWYYSGNSTPFATNVSSVTVSSAGIVYAKAPGCFNSNNITLSLAPLNLSVTQAGSTLVAPLSDNYQWIDCNGNTLIPGQTSQVFNATVIGSYAVIVSQNTCHDTSACYFVSNIGINKIEDLNAINLSPNPTSKVVKINTSLVLNQANIKLKNLTGQTVVEYKNQSGNNFTIDLSEFSNGVYFVEIQQNDKVWRNKVIKD